MAGTCVFYQGVTAAKIMGSASAHRSEGSGQWKWGLANSSEGLAWPGAVDKSEGLGGQAGAGPVN